MQTPERFPERMRRKARWLGWKWGNKEPSRRWVYFDPATLEAHDGHMWHRRTDGTLERASKLPLNVRTMRPASVSDPDTWSDFEAALDALRRGRVHGLGYVLDAGEVLLDIDGCVEGGELDAFSRAVVSKLDSYSELSVSGQGVHIVCVADGFTPDRGQKGARVEVYAGGHTNRYCTVSGSALDGCDELNDDAADVLQEIYQVEFADRPVITEETREASAQFLSELRLVELSQDDERAVAWCLGHFKHARAMFTRGDFTGWAKDRATYQPDKDRSQSAADAALASYLLCATDCDPDRTLALLNASGMWRPKYAEIHDGHNAYVTMTVANVMRATDPAKMRLEAYARRDAALASLTELRPDMRPLADLMRRDDVTDRMLRHVMAHHARGAAQQDFARPISSYRSDLVRWIERQWPRVVELAYTFDLGLGGD